MEVSIKPTCGVLPFMAWRDADSHSHDNSEAQIVFKVSYQNGSKFRSNLEKLKPDSSVYFEPTQMNNSLSNTRLTASVIPILLASDLKTLARRHRGEQRIEVRTCKNRTDGRTV